MKAKSSYPGEVYLEHHLEAINDMAAVVIITTARPGTSFEEMDLACDLLITLCNSAKDRVRGNRSDTTRVEWADYRLVLAATLRLFLDQLEGGA